MADSKLCHSTVSSGADLLQCGICFAVIDEPKALPCLHTYCLKCLTDWSKSSAKKNPAKYTDTISCPTCREDFVLPKGGVKQFKTNFFVNKLKERNTLKQKLHEKNAKILCTSCDGSDNQAVGRCVECNDFLCKKCIESHKSLRVFKHHHVLSLEELKAGKLTMPNLPEQGMCFKHTGEVLRFYCETCDEPMCRDCTVVDHPRPDHKQIDLKSAAGQRNDELEKLYNHSKTIPKDMDSAMKEDENILKDLTANVAKAISVYQKTASNAESKFIEKMRKLETERRKKIETHRESLQFQKLRLCTALETAKQVTQNRSDHDVATMYSALSGTMKQLGTLQPRAIRKLMANVEFTPSTDIDDGLGSLGKLNTTEQWVSVTRIGSGQLRYARSIVYNKYGEIAVANHNSGSDVTVLGENGVLRRSIVIRGVGGGDASGTSRPWGLAVGKDGHYYVTDLNWYVKVLDAQGNFKQRFGAKSPNGNWSYNDGSQLYGLAINSKGQVFVGSSFKYISIHEQDGTHVSSFHINLVPYFIVCFPYDRVIVSNYSPSAIHVYDTSGTHLHTFSTPPGGQLYPTGLCVSDGDVLVASEKKVPAIYRYSVTGEYIGIVTEDVASPWGIALRNDEDELIVSDGQEIKVFHPK